MISHCGFDLHLLDYIGVPFHVSVYFGEMSIMFLCPFLIRFFGGGSFYEFFMYFEC